MRGAFQLEQLSLWQTTTGVIRMRRRVGDVEQRRELDASQKAAFETAVAQFWDKAKIVPEPTAKPSKPVVTWSLEGFNYVEEGEPGYNDNHIVTRNHKQLGEAWKENNRFYWRRPDKHVVRFQHGAALYREVIDTVCKHGGVARVKLTKKQK